MKPLVFILLLFTASYSFSQFIEASFPAPSDNITGLAYGDLLWAIDSVDCCIYGVDVWSGALEETVLLPVLDNPPAGLGISPGGFWFAESGTAIIHYIDFDGNPVSTMDFSDSGIQTISGVEYLQWSPSYPYLYFIDSSDRSVYTVSLAIGPQSLYKNFTIADDITVHDIGGAFPGIPVACDDGVSPVRFYEDESTYYSLGGGTYHSAIGVASTFFERIYFSDPVMGMIHRYCISMGGTEENTGEALPTGIICSLGNPVMGAVELTLQLEKAEIIHFQIYNLSGRMVHEIAEDTYPRGTQTVELGSFSPGVYFYNLITESNTISSSFTVLE